MQRKKKLCKKCKHYKYIFSKGLCISCCKKEFPEKFSIKKSDKPLRGSKLNQISSKQQERLALYRKLRDEYFLKEPICEFVDDNGIRCTSKEIDLHHKAGRTGDNLFMHFMSLCREHHQWCHKHFNKAKEKEYII